MTEVNFVCSSFNIKKLFHSFSAEEQLQYPKSAALRKGYVLVLSEH